MTQEELEKAVQNLHLKKCKDFIESSKLTVIEQVGKAFIVEPKKNFFCSRWYEFVVVAKNHDDLENIVKEANENVNFYYYKELDNPFLKYINSIFKLTVVSLRGQEDSEEDDKVRDSMYHWDDMSEDQRDIANVIGANLNLLEDMLEALHGEKWPLL
jgi:hypothetical protein